MLLLVCHREGGADTFGPSVQYGYHRGSRKSLPGHIEILVGQPGKSCDEVCADTDHSKCAPQGFTYLNDCNRMTALVDCHLGCREDPAWSNKGFTRPRFFWTKIALTVVVRPR